MSLHRKDSLSAASFRIKRSNDKICFVELAPVFLSLLECFTVFRAGRLHFGLVNSFQLRLGEGNEFREIELGRLANQLLKLLLGEVFISTNLQQ